MQHVQTHWSHSHVSVKLDSPGAELCAQVGHAKFATLKTNFFQKLFRAL